MITFMPFGSSVWIQERGFLDGPPMTLGVSLFRVPRRFTGF